MPRNIHHNFKSHSDATAHYHTHTNQETVTLANSAAWGFAFTNQKTHADTVAGSKSIANTTCSTTL
jgi:hypothetical protein